MMICLVTVESTGQWVKVKRVKNKTESDRKGKGKVFHNSKLDSAFENQTLSDVHKYLMAVQMMKNKLFCLR